MAAIDGLRVPSGDYTVILGPQPVADLCNNLIIPSCQAGSFYSSSTPFLGRLGRVVALKLLRAGALAGVNADRARFHPHAGVHGILQQHEGVGQRDEVPAAEQPDLDAVTLAGPGLDHVDHSRRS